MTGAGGFVGGHLREALAASDPAPVVIGAGLPLQGEPGSTAALDLTDAAAVDAFVERERPGVVIHLAAQASVGAVLAGAAVRTWAVNLGGTLNLAMAVARHMPTATLLFTSSSEVYGRAFGTEPVGEEAICQPINAYARSKLMAERVLTEILPSSARLVIARPFSHIGPGQREDFVLSSFAAQIARIEAGSQPPTLWVGNLDVRRDFLNVRDVVAAYIGLVAAAPRLPPGFTCNVASGSARPLREVLDILCRHARVPFDVKVDPARLRPSEIPIAAGRPDRLKAAIGWAPAIGLDDTLASLLEDARRRVSQDGTPT